VLSIEIVAIENDLEVEIVREEVFEEEIVMKESKNQALTN
jgi:hypothetical protein